MLLDLGLKTDGVPLGFLFDTVLWFPKEGEGIKRVQLVFTESTAGKYTGYRNSIDSWKGLVFLVKEDPCVSFFNSCEYSSILFN